MRLKFSISLKFITSLYLLLSMTLPLSAVDWQFRTAGRVVAMSDIHGAHKDFVGLLQGVGLIDEQASWIGGEDHLVIVGDILDRGADSRAALELTMRLETEAEKAGGRVHMLLGNHEIMNLVGDLRYVANAEYAAYQDVEDPTDRTAALKSYIRFRAGGEADETTITEQFNKKHPPGFFGHQALFAAKGTLGSWLLKRPVSVMVNDSVFVHGGLSPAVAGQSLEEINHTHQRVITDFLSSREYFIEKGFLEAGTNFYDQPSLLKQFMQLDGNRSKANKTAEKKLMDAYHSSVFAEDAPTWYRGNVGCSQAIERERLRQLLSSLGASRLVVGHTPTPSRTIENRFDELVIRVDTGMLKSSYRGQASAAIIEGDKISTYYLESNETVPSTAQHRRVGPGPGGLSDAMLEEIYAGNKISSVQALEDGRSQVLLDYEEQQLESIFSPVKASRKQALNIPAVASYRLDKLLGLEMVPASVSRPIDEKPGSLSLNPARLMDEKQRVARQLGASAWCPLKDQFNMMYVFDLLLHNKGRKLEAMRYSAGDMRLVLIDNEEVLDTQSGAPRYLKSLDLSLPGDVRTELEAMDEALLEKLLGDVLDEKRRKAILKRRDVLLKQAR